MNPFDPALQKDWQGLVKKFSRARNDFPILFEKIYDKPLVYLDNAATTQKPKAVLRALEEFYCKQNANIHRGVFCLSEKATRLYENSRVKVQKFLNAENEKEIIFTRGATEAINLVAATYGREHVGMGDEILITHLEHHSNIVPWQMLCEEKRAKLQVVGMNMQGEILLDNFKSKLNSKTKIAAITFVSNALGTVNPVKEMIRLAHERGIPVLVDGAQAMLHVPVDVQDLDCDFFVFSGHKVCAPTGIGALYGKQRHLEKMRPYQGGGDMIERVTFEKTTYQDLPYRFEAGTPHIAGSIGLGAALDYIKELDLRDIRAYEEGLLKFLEHEMMKIEGLKIIGRADKKVSVTSFTLGQAHAYDIGTILDREGIAIRTGHHCAMPVMDFFGLSGTARASLAFYNNLEDIQIFTAALRKVVDIFR